MMSNTLGGYKGLNSKYCHLCTDKILCILNKTNRKCIVSLLNCFLVKSMTLLVANAVK